MAETMIEEIAATKSLLTRHAVARLLARYFLVHLKAELAKPDEVLFEVHKDKPVRQMLSDLIRRVRSEFNIGEEEPLPADNIFERWCKINGRWDYKDSAFIAYKIGRAHV